MKTPKSRDAAIVINTCIMVHQKIVYSPKSRFFYFANDLIISSARNITNDVVSFLWVFEIPKQYYYLLPVHYCAIWGRQYIMQTSPCNEYPLTPHCILQWHVFEM